MVVLFPLYCCHLPHLLIILKTDTEINGYYFYVVLLDYGTNITGSSAFDVHFALELLDI